MVLRGGRCSSLVSCSCKLAGDPYCWDLFKAERAARRVSILCSRSTRVVQQNREECSSVKVGHVDPPAYHSVSAVSSCFVGGGVISARPTCALQAPAVVSLSPSDMEACRVLRWVNRVTKLGGKRGNAVIFSRLFKHGGLTPKSCLRSRWLRVNVTDWRLLERPTFYVNAMRCILRRPFTPATLRPS